MEENQLKSLTCKNLIGQSSNRVTTFHILPFLGLSCPSSLSLSSFTLASPVGLFSRENPPPRPRLFHFPGKFRPFGPFSCSLPISILLTFSSLKNRRSFTFFDCDQTA
ncbi:hypothetical protein WN944_019183 [Citrus x changshan-huyou]|uniref:Uncharacterized protein n=1 Tax=Citrus x changshan-huyou TaxID=2935761 RepID=A0AAP0M161_9ROSI